MHGLWFRLYTDLLDSMKVQTLPDATFKFWINLLCVIKQKNNGGMIPDDNEIAFLMRLKTKKSASVIHSHLKILEEHGLIDRDNDRFVIHDWEDAQPKSDTDTSNSNRQKRYREAHKNDSVTESNEDSNALRNGDDNAQVNVTSNAESNVTVTPLEKSKSNSKRREEKNLKREVDFVQADKLAHDLFSLHRDLVDEKYAVSETNIAGWAEDIERLHRIDGRDWGEIGEVIHWVKSDRFWAPNIMSGKKLREKYPTLIARMRQQPTPAHSGGAPPKVLSQTEFLDMQEG